MSHKSSQINRQQRIGYLLLAGAGLSIIANIFAVLIFDFPSIVIFGAAPIILILMFFGFRNISASRNENVITDERLAEIYYTAGYNSFWTMMAVITIDIPFKFTPDEGVRGIYLAIGLTTFILSFIYHRYIR